MCIYKNIIEEITSNNELNKLFYNAIAHKLDKDSSVSLSFENKCFDINIETLKEHSDRSIWAFYFLMKGNNFIILENIINKSINYNLLDNNLNYETVKKQFTLLIFLSVYLHDFGKLNPYFQSKIRQIEANKEKTFFNSEEFKNKWCDTKYPFYYSHFSKIFLDKCDNHSEFNFLSLIINNFFHEFHKEKKERSKIKKENRLFDIQKIISFFEKNIIPKHHSGPYYSSASILNEGKFLAPFESINDFVFVSELLFEFIGFSDILSTVFFMEKHHLINNKPLSFEEEIIKLEQYVNYKVYSNKLDYKKLSSFEFVLDYNKEIYKDISDDAISEIKNLNHLKTKIGRAVAKKTRLSNNNLNIIKAPTGTGKTNLSYIYINETLKKRTDINRILFINPLNSLNYQVKETAEKAFNLKYDYINILNSETKIEHQYNNDDDEKLNAKSIDKFTQYNYPFIVTSHVNFFDKLYSKNKKDKHSLIYLSNSLIIIDEIQLYRDSLSLINFHYLNLLEKYLNINTLIISATIPVPSELDDEIVIGSENLIKNKYLFSEEYTKEIFEHEVFKRITYNLDFFDTYEDPKYSIFEIKNIEELKGNNSILITHNSLKKCNEIYNKIKLTFEAAKYKIYFYNSTILPCFQEDILNNIKLRLKNNERTLVIATSKIETGIDISFSYGIRFSTSIQDILQNGGRINRDGNGKKENHTLYIIKDELKSRKSEEIIPRLSADNSTEKKFYKKFFNGSDTVNVDKFYDLVFKNLEEDSSEWRNIMNNNLSLLKNPNAYSFESLSKIKTIPKQTYTTYNFFVNDNIEIFNLDEQSKLLLTNLNIKESKEIFIKLNTLKPNEKEIYERLISILKKISFNVYLYEKDLNNSFLKSYNMSLTDIKTYKRLKINEINQYFIYDFSTYIKSKNFSIYPINSYFILDKKIENEDLFYKYSSGFMQYIDINEELDI